VLLTRLLSAVAVQQEQELILAQQAHQVLLQAQTLRPSAPLVVAVVVLVVRMS
jgi:hypothetical protein